MQNTKGFARTDDASLSNDFDLNLPSILAIQML